MLSLLMAVRVYAMVKQCETYSYAGSTVLTAG